MVLELFTFNMLGIILYGKEEYNHHYLSRNKLITLRYGHKFMDSSYKVCSWGTSDESGRLCTLCPKQVCESEYHTLIQCSAFDHIRLCFPHLFDRAQSLHEFLSQPQCALSIATFIGKVIEHRESLLTLTRIMWNVIFFGLIGHIWIQLHKYLFDYKKSSPILYSI